MTKILQSAPQSQFILREKTKKDIEAAWNEHKAGKSIPLDKVMKEYSQ